MHLAKLARVRGPNLVLRLVQPEDAAYVYGLRTNPAYNRHLSEVRGTVADQRHWIEGYKAREAAGSEYYYVIERSDNVPCGVVRLYEIRQESFTWGSWILDQNKTHKAALESAFLVYSIAFDILDLYYAHFKVARENEVTISFHLRFGAVQTHVAGQDACFVYTRDKFDVEEERFTRLLGAARNIAALQQ